MLTLEERETIINFNAVDKVVSIYTSQPEVWRRLEGIPGFRLLEEGKIDGRVATKEFGCPKSFVRWGKRGLLIGAPRPVSREQRKIWSEKAKRTGFGSATRHTVPAAGTSDMPDGVRGRGEVSEG